GFENRAFKEHVGFSCSRGRNAWRRCGRTLLFLVFFVFWNGRFGCGRRSRRLEGPEELGKPRGIGRCWGGRRGLLSSGLGTFAVLQGPIRSEKRKVLSLFPLLSDEIFGMFLGRATRCNGTGLRFGSRRERPTLLSERVLRYRLLALQLLNAVLQFDD